MEQKYINRLWQRVVKSDGCWKWTGSLDSKGYAQYSCLVNGKTKTHRCHRVIFEMIKGPIPDGLVLDHLCRNRWCTNPDHLDPVTFQENLKRGKNVNGHWQGSDRCKHNHKLTEENSWIHPTTKKVRCRTCLRRNAEKTRIKNRLNKKPREIKTHCKNGHERNNENMRVIISSGKNHRQCRVCDREKKVNKRIHGAPTISTGPESV